MSEIWMEIHIEIQRLTFKSWSIIQNIFYFTRKQNLHLKASKFDYFSDDHTSVCVTIWSSENNIGLTNSFISVSQQLDDKDSQSYYYILSLPVN